MLPLQMLCFPSPRFHMCVTLSSSKTSVFPVRAAPALQTCQKPLSMSEFEKWRDVPSPVPTPGYEWSQATGSGTASPCAVPGMMEMSRNLLLHARKNSFLTSVRPVGQAAGSSRSEKIPLASQRTRLEMLLQAKALSLCKPKLSHGLLLKQRIGKYRF